MPSGWRSVLRVDFQLLSWHLVLNMICVEAWNLLLESSMCKGILLACCDPFTYVPWPLDCIPLKLGPNVCLLLHFYHYERTAFTYTRACGSEVTAHVNLAICQLAWFAFEYMTFVHTYSLERLTMYTPEGAHPCPERSGYYSTWIPIWQDFVYNSAGQAVGLLLHRRRRARFSRLFQSASLIRWPWHLGDDASTDCC